MRPTTSQLVQRPIWQQIGFFVQMIPCFSTANSTHGEVVTRANIFPLGNHVTVFCRQHADFLDDGMRTGELFNWITFWHHAADAGRVPCGLRLE